MALFSFCQGIASKGTVSYSLSSQAGTGRVAVGSEGSDEVTLAVGACMDLYAVGLLRPAQRPGQQQVATHQRRAAAPGRHSILRADPRQAGSAQRRGRGTTNTTPRR